MIKFVYEVPEAHQEFTATKNVVMEIQDESNLDEMLDAYAHFLKAIGYNFDGQICITEEEL